MYLQITHKGKLIAVFTIESFQCCKDQPISLEQSQQLSSMKCERFMPLPHFPLDMRRDPKNRINLIFIAHNPNQNLGIYVNSDGKRWFIDRVLEMRFIQEKGNLPVIQSKYELMQTIGPSEWSLIVIKNDHFHSNFENQVQQSPSQDPLFMLDNPLKT